MKKSLLFTSLLRKNGILTLGIARRTVTRYTLPMFFFSPHLSFRFCAALAACMFLAGCAAWTFTTLHESRFINVDAQVLHVEYGREKRTETLPNGLVCTYEGKVRVTLFDGGRVVLYQTLSISGNRYLSADKHYEFTEKAPYCILKRDGVLLFEGIYCRH